MCARPEHAADGPFELLVGVGNLVGGAPRIREGVLELNTRDGQPIFLRAPPPRDDDDDDEDGGAPAPAPALAPAPDERAAALARAWQETLATSGVRVESVRLPKEALAARAAELAAARDARALPCAWRCRARVLAARGLRAADLSGSSDPYAQVCPVTAAGAELAEDRRRATPRRARTCLLYTSPSPRDGLLSRMPSSA